MNGISPSQAASWYKQNINSLQIKKALPAITSSSSANQGLDWLNQMAAAQPSDFAYQGDPSGEDLSAFLDISPFEEHPSIPEVAPPAAAGGRALSMSPSGVKRKIEVVDLPEAPAGDVPSAKKKR